MVHKGSIAELRVACVYAQHRWLLLALGYCIPVRVERSHRFTCRRYGYAQWGDPWKVSQRRVERNPNAQYQAR